MPASANPDDLLDAFFAYVTELGLDLYPAQEEAILEVFADSNVVLNTPTGSGKSLVATAAHFYALANGKRSVYTAPIKALVSEKFFALCRDFGTDRVGMVTGDASVNKDAPIICCTAEILANWALREGDQTPVDVVIADEFHYYGDPQRGWAWQTPLLTLPQSQFLLMSATLGDTERFETELKERTGRETVLVKSTERPVPLDFDYSTLRLVHSIEKLLDSGKAPIYIVHFTQREATEQAQSLLSVNVLTKEEKQQINELIGGFRFDTPIGKEMRRFLTHGIGLHHAGLLPKYRLLVEKLAQAGLLKLICGTDTLGVGVNVPIRSVLFTQLCKYDGTSVRPLQVREFQQIAGRAGRRGYDDRGTVWAQAPAHWVENRIQDEKAASGGKKKQVKKKAPERGYSHWDENMFNKLINGEPESLTSSFQVTHQMMLNMLDRPGDGCRSMKELLRETHETHKRRRGHQKRAISIFRSLVEAEVLEFLDEPDELDRHVRVTLDLQDSFALNQPLSLYALEAIEALDQEYPTYALDVVSVIEAILENPRVILAEQRNKVIQDALAEMKREGIEYDERMDKIADLTYPKPLSEFLYHSFDLFRVHHPWTHSDNVAPKAIVRDMYEQSMTFKEYINHYGLKRSEGVLLRYLTDAYRALRQTVPEECQTEEVIDLTEWLGEVVRQTDSSLIDEWSRLQNPEDDPSELATPTEVTRSNVTTNKRAFAIMVRNATWAIVEALSRRNNVRAAELAGGDWRSDDIAEAMTPYWDTHDALTIDADARSVRHVDFVNETTLHQALVDPEEWNEWRLVVAIDIDASINAGEAVVELTSITRQGDR
jgi:superfamily II RNA helicase